MPRGLGATGWTLALYMHLSIYMFAGGSSGCPVSSDGTHIDRRGPWISERPATKGEEELDPTALQEGGGFSTWPIDPIIPFRRSVRYCWESRDDFHKLDATLQAAIALWKPAMGSPNEPVSSLMIRPDGSGQQRDLLCKHARPDALRIATVSDQHGRHHGLSTSGYLYQPPEIETTGRHRLIFDALQDLNPDNHRTPGAYDVYTLAHELGHVIGLDHEHQRPDRDLYLSFYCHNLHDYAYVREILEPPDTIEEACTDAEVAAKYNFSAHDFIPLALVAPHGRRLAHSRRFDYDSIMIYDSYEGSTIPATLLPDGPKDKAVLLRHPPSKVWKPNPEHEIEYFPGNVTPRQADKIKISDGDIARVAQLYPNLGPVHHDDRGATHASNPLWAPATTSSPAARRLHG